MVTMPVQTVFYTLALSITLYQSSLAQGTGKLYIGINNVTNPSVFSYSINSRNGSIPVYASVINVTTGDLIKIENDVQISCAVSLNTPGYSKANFAPQNVSVSSIQANETLGTDIIFENAVSGRAVELRCWGESVGFDSSIGNTTQPQFSKTGSLSDPVLFQVRESATVDFCGEVVIVPQTKDAKVTFDLEFSEAIADFNVTVICSVNTSSVPSGFTPMNLSIQSENAYVGQSNVQLSATVLQPGYQVVVSCNAQSDVGIQFLTSTSTGSPALFASQSGKVTLYPSLTAQHNISFKTFLVLDTEPQKDVTFSCQVRVVHDNEEALRVAQNPVCKTVIESRPSTPSTPDNTTGDLTTESPSTTSPATTSVSSSTEAPTSASDTLTSDAGSTDSLASSPAVTTTTTSATLTTTAVPLNITEWSLSPASVTFTASSKVTHKPLIATRYAYPPDRLQELIVVTCCAPADNNNDPVYTNQSAAMLAVSNMAPLIAINWTAAPLSTAEKKESAIPNPAFVDLSACPCDMTSGHCDTNCCCDQDCTESEKQTFTCIPGIRGGFGKDEEPHRKCFSNHFNKADWFPLMCVETENNALLGLFYQSTALLNRDSYDAKVDPVRPANSYRDSGKRNTDEAGVGVGNLGYTDGLSVKTGDNNSPLIKSGNNYRLSLPQQSLSGECFEEAPVRYLRDFDNDCEREVTADICGEDSPLNARIYAMATTVTQPPCPRPPYVLTQHGGEEVTVTLTNYHCAPDATEYLKKYEKASDFYKPDQRSLFNYNLPEQNATNCYMDTQTGVLKCDGQEGAPPVLTPPLPDRCSWDNSYALPPAPTFNNVTQMCENAVLKVHYNFTWLGTRILQLNATYVIGDLPLVVRRQENQTVVYSETVYENQTVIVFNQTTNTTYNVTELTAVGSRQLTQTEEVTLNNTAILTQNFKVEFSHLFNQSLVNSTESTNKTVPSGKYDRSGMPGYIFDKPVVSGTSVFNESTSDFVQVDTSPQQTLRLWQPNLNGLCMSSTATTVTFGQNSRSSCVLRLTRDDLLNCDYLRKLVLNRLDSLMPSDSVGKLGDYPDRFTERDWIKVMRQDLSSVIGIIPTLPPTTSDNVTESNITTESSVTTEGTTETVTTEVTTATLENITTPDLNYTFVSQLTGVCPNITSGIHIDIMYAEPGKAKGQPIYEIVAAKISYSLANWQMTCMGGDSGRCYDNSSLVQSFTVSSSVNFIQVPPQPPAPVTKYAAEHTRKSCDQNACWEQLAYPLTRAFTGDPFDYNLSFGLVSILFLVGLFFISKPWW